MDISGPVIDKEIDLIPAGAWEKRIDVTGEEKFVTGLFTTSFGRPPIFNLILLMP
jgi:hypothetical protein